MEHQCLQNPCVCAELFNEIIPFTTLCSLFFLFLSTQPPPSSLSGADNRRSSSQHVAAQSFIHINGTVWHPDVSCLTLRLLTVRCNVQPTRVAAARHEEERIAIQFHGAALPPQEQLAADALHEQHAQLAASPRGTAGLPQRLGRHTQHLGSGRDVRAGLHHGGACRIHRCLRHVSRVRWAEEEPDADARRRRSARHLSVRSG